MNKFYLDPSAQNSENFELTIVDNEVSLLRALSHGGSVLIQGDVLCKWAKNIADSRSIDIVLLESPATELVEILPALSFENAKGFFNDHKDIFRKIKRPINPIDIFQALWPDANLMGRDFDEYHALNWLIFLIETDFNEFDKKFISAVSVSFVEEAPDIFRCVYSANCDSAWAKFIEWNKIKESNCKWPPIPGSVELPIKSNNRLLSEFSSQLIQTDGLFFEKFILREPPVDLIRKVAREAVKFFRSNPLLINHKTFELLDPFLKLKDRDTLLTLLPPNDPGLPPVEIYKLIQWFKRSYLPFRIWSQLSNDHNSTIKVDKIIKSFSSWFLDYYVTARVGGKGAELFSWSKTAELGISNSNITLLIVLDGLGYRDAEFISKQITGLSSRLSVEDFEIVVSPLPTVTEFAKKALFAGLPPSKAIEIREQIGVFEKGVPAIIRSLNSAKPGDVVIWSLVEPDNIYHKKSDARSICREIEGWLHGFSQKIVDVANEVNASKILNIIITTDHGRLLSGSTRMHDVPKDMVAHGRAAWGGTKRGFGKEGYIVEDNIAYLHPDRFGVPEVCAILLNGDSFKMIDGRGGEESFPHGGIYPEEVFIPWLSMVRDQSEVKLNVILGGRGVAGASGTYDLEIINPGNSSVYCFEFVLPISGEIVPLDLEIKAMCRFETNIKTKNWPKKTEVEKLEATLNYGLPSGERRGVSVHPVLEIEEMYQQNDILNDW
jgi:hypothetical protein